MARKFFNLRVKDPGECRKKSFRTHDVGEKGGHMRIACRRKRTGKWMTQAWRLPKAEWKRRGKTLTPVTPKAKRMKKSLTRDGKMRIVRKKGDDYDLKRRR